MSQLTSIQALRNSTALQGRVDQVERFLKQLNPNWQANWWFPIGIIRVSNDSADCTWVRDHTSTHHKGVGNLIISGVTIEASRVIDALKGVQANDFERLSNFNAAIHPLGGGQSIDWKDGMITMEDAAAQVPFVKTEGVKARSTPAKKPASTTKATGSGSPAPIKTKASKPTKLDEAKKLFNDLTPKQKVEFMQYAQQKVGASTACQEALDKLTTPSVL